VKSAIDSSVLMIAAALCNGDKS